MTSEYRKVEHITRERGLFVKMYISAMTLQPELTKSKIIVKLEIS